MQFNITQLKNAFKKKGYVWETQPWKLNLIGVRTTINKINVFNDLLYVVYVDNNGSEFIHEYPITTKPGLYYLNNPASNSGTAILVPGQYRNAYGIRNHAGKYKALGQNRNVTVYRDNDRNNYITLIPSSKQDGLFGINIHRSNPRSESAFVNKWSAGCQVFKRISDFKFVMQLANKSKKVNNNNFTYTLLDISELSGSENTISNPPLVSTPLPTLQTSNSTTTINSSNIVEPSLRNDKEILNIEKGSRPSILIPQPLEDNITNESEIVGDLYPHIIYMYDEKKYTFSYREIKSFRLYYDSNIPKIYISIIDNNNLFKSTILKNTTSDLLTLYLNSKNDNIKDIIIEFDVLEVNQNNRTINMEGIINIPNLHNTEINHYNNNSYNVFKEVASRLKLGFNSNCVPTIDTMSWIQPNISNYEFLNYVSKYAYNNEDSFYKWFIDFYYNLNFIDVNKQYGEYQSQDSFITHLNNSINNSEKFNIDGKNILTNLSLLKGTNNYIYNFRLTNNLTNVSLKHGTKHNCFFYDLELKENTDFDILLSKNKDESELFNNKDISTNVDEFIMDSEYNTHKYFYYSKHNNLINNKHIDNYYLEFELLNSNFLLYKYQNVPVAIYTENQLNKDAIKIKNNETLSFEDNVNGLLIEQLSGYFVIIDIEYHWNNKLNQLKQKIKVSKRT